MTYTGWMEVSAHDKAEALDISTMRQLDRDAYKSYVKDHLLFMDHHEILRSTFCDYPYATTPEQIDVFIEVLKEYRQKMIF